MSKILDSNLTQQIKTYTDLLEQDIVFEISTDDTESSNKILSFVEAVASLSPKLSVKKTTLNRTPSFNIKNEATGRFTSFAALPLGHELSSFVLSLLQVSGRQPKIEETLIKRIQSINTKLDFTSYISLSCHICPDVVQALNIMAVLNENITHTMVDGGIFQDEIKALDIMAVPTVYANGEVFANGRITLEEIVEQILGAEELSLDANKIYDQLVVGGGPAGSSAAIYSARKGLSVIMITDRLGGQVLETMSIENLISVPYTEGPKLANALELHMNEYPIEIIKSKTVTSIAQNETFEVTLDDGNIIKAKTIVLATGARWRNVNVPGEKEFKNKGVAYCPHCDGPIFANKHVAVIGGGNSGIEAAIDLANITSHVTVVEFLEELKADKVLQEKLHSLDNVTVITSAQTTEITGESSVNGLSYKDRSSDVNHHIDLDGVFVQIGLVPNTEFLGSEFEKTKMGELVVDSSGMTNIPGIFAAGDCTDSKYKQIIISMGSGATAALGAFDYLIRNDK